ncbi:MAG: carboxypeptidase regulatory-like domain-containing protein [bacterium]
MIARALRILALLALAPAGTRVAQAQRAQLSGMVVDMTSKAGLPDADIIHVDGGRTVVSDSLGRFAFPDLPSGIIRLLVRVRGFPASRVTLALAKGESMSRVIELDSTSAGRAAAQSLPSVSTVAARPPLPRYVDFERRRLTGRGQYLASEDLEKGGFSTLQDAMRGLRGVNLDCGGSNGCYIRMARAPMRCLPEYVVDERVDNSFGPTTPIRDIEGIEVYTGPSDVPGEFAGRTAGCGVIVIWTRSGPSRTKP